MVETKGHLKVTGKRAQGVCGSLAQGTSGAEGEGLGCSRWGAPQLSVCENWFALDEHPKVLGALTVSMQAPPGQSHGDRAVSCSHLRPLFGVSFLLPAPHFLKIILVKLC